MNVPTSFSTFSLLQPLQTLVLMSQALGFRHSLVVYWKLCLYLHLLRKANRHLLCISAKKRRESVRQVIFVFTRFKNHSKVLLQDRSGTHRSVLRLLLMDCSLSFWQLNRDSPHKVLSYCLQSIRWKLYKKKICYATNNAGWSNCQCLTNSWIQRKISIWMVVLSVLRPT